MFTEFFNMGGYGFYVWLAYGGVALVLGLILFVTWRQECAVRKQLIDDLKRQTRASTTQTPAD